MKVLIFLAVCAVAYSTSINPEAQKQLVNIIPSLDPQTVDFLQTLLSTPEAVEYLKKDTNLQKQFEQALGVDSLFTDEADGERCLLLLSWLTVLSKFVTVTASG